MKPKRGRPRTGAHERRTAKFKALLQQGATVRDAQDESGLNDGQVVAVLTELFEVLRDAA